MGQMTLTETDLAELSRIVEELPFKHAIAIANFFSRKAEEKNRQSLAAMQAAHAEQQRN